MIQDISNDNVVHMSIPIVSEKEIEERGGLLKESRMPVLNIKIGPQNINPRNATAYDIPFEAKSSKILSSAVFRDNIILDIRKKLREVKVNYCDTDTLKLICDIGELVDIQSRYFIDSKAFDLLVKDVNDLQKDFIYNCKSIPLENVRTEIEKDVRATFGAINVPMKPEDRMEMFSFYLSGLMKGYVTVFENMRVEFEFSLVDKIMKIFSDYEKGDISAYDAWIYIEELMIQDQE